MNTAKVAPPHHPNRPSQAPIKLLVFHLGSLTLGLPILQVQKIVRQNNLHGSGLSHVKLAHLPNQEVAVVDLHQKLFGTSALPTLASGYFIICRHVAGEPLGIFTPQAPTLINIAPEQIRLLPQSYRRADTLEIASHVTIINDPEIASAEQDITVFILDLDKLV